MPAAKMVADSTQSDAALERKKRRRDEKDYHRKNKRDDYRSRHSRSPHRNSSNSKRSVGSHSEKSNPKEEEVDDSENSDMDLSKPLKPIGSYIKDRSAMLEQMFHCIKGSKMKRVIPDELQSMSHQELKQRCLAQLEVMSKKRILRILAGDDPANISSSGTEESGDDLENTDKKSSPMSNQPGHNPESHPADSTSSSSTAKWTKLNSNRNKNLSLVNQTSDSHLLPQSVTMPNLDNQSLNLQVTSYSLSSTMGPGVLSGCPKSRAASLHWLHQPTQQSVINLPAEVGQLQSKSPISTPLFPPYRHALEVDCSDFPINITSAPTRKEKKESVPSPSSALHHRRLPKQIKLQQRNATSSIRPFACSGSDYCICGRCFTPVPLSQAGMTESMDVAASNVMASSSDTCAPVIPGSTAGGDATAAKTQVVPTRILVRTQMEVLELEMRARAIKAMLQAASQCRPLQQQQQQQEQPPPSL